MSFKDTFKGRKILVTGHAGFKGSWLTLWLKSLGADVCGYSLMPDTEHTAYEAMGISEILSEELVCDILDKSALLEFFRKTRPEIVFHLAAQPLVRLSYEKPELTYETNVIGTLNVLQAARKTESVKALVNVTTDKCYENFEDGRLYKENDPMGGFDMYSSSKGCSEILSASFRRSFLEHGKPYALGCARAGNVIGGGDWAKDRIIPDCVRALVANRPIEVRNPKSVRPWQFVLEPLAGYLRLAQMLLQDPEKFADGFNFGPNSDSELSVEKLVETMLGVWGSGAAKFAETESVHEAKLLMLDISKAERLLGVKPVLDAKGALEFTARWYKNFHFGAVASREFSLWQIDAFCAAARKKNLDWTL